MIGGDGSGGVRDQSQGALYDNPQLYQEPAEPQGAKRRDHCRQFQARRENGTWSVVILDIRVSRVETH